MIFKHKPQKEVKVETLDDVILEHRRRKTEGRPYDPFWVEQMTRKEFDEAMIQRKTFVIK